ncbi:MAG: VIT1/CCC1 transporter family protein [Halobacteriaceae archaeon]
MMEAVLGDDIDASGRYLAEVIYGANDGIVTTFAVVSGVADAALNPSIVLILGAANLFADGFSMGMSNYLSRRSAIDYHRARSRAGTADTREDGKAPGRTAAVTFLAFVVAGWAPLLPTSPPSIRCSSGRSPSRTWPSSRSVPVAASSPTATGP